MKERGRTISPTMLQPPQTPYQAAEKAIAQRKILLNQNQPPSKQKDKIFGRAAYHVAIAYHIHLKKIKDSGQILNNSS